ncbi:uncharacterized protein TNCV_4654691 [Trichonephila clavipes]|nr:uncharacterized protein TNCV_4654691 [Trichonephila clavipes]
MSEKALVDNIFVRLEPQVQDYVEVRNPQTAIQLLEVLAKFEERYSCKATLGSRNSNDVKGRGWNKRRISNVGNNRGNWRNSEVTEDYDLPSSMEFLKNRKDFFKDLRLGTALNEMLCDAREFADKIDIPANFELTQPRHRVRLI